MRTASIHLCRQWIGPTCAAAAVFSVVGGVGLIAAQLLRAPALPGLQGLAVVIGASAPVLGEWVVPLGGLAGLALLLARWRAEGDWTALQAAGLSGRTLVPGILAGGLVLALATGALAHLGAPWGRATLVDTLVHQVVPLPGRATSIGDLTLLPGRVDDDGLGDLFLAWGDGEHGLVAHAASGQLGESGQLVLLDGQVLGPAGHLAFGRLALPLPTAFGRPPPSAWPDRALAESGEPYHLALRYKRTIWPLASLLLLLLAVPGVLSGRSWTVPLSVVGWWAAVRVCDGLAASLGGLGSAVLPLVLLAVSTGWCWSRWEGR